jgi:hypothetical protein
MFPLALIQTGRSIGQRAAISAILLSTCGGCALIPLATVGAVVDIAGTAASAGPAVYKAGKLDTAFIADSIVVEAAVRAAAADLCLRVMRDSSKDKRGDVWVYQFEDDWKTKVEVTLERRTRMLCLCRINVGFFGSEPTARLVLTGIEQHLPPPPTPLKVSPTTATKPV